MCTTREEFYGTNSGINYAVARYLCYYLQEHGQLEGFYKEFRENVGEERAAARALEATVGKKLGEFEKNWRAWVLTLKYE